jgi:serine phosphatase RsbU (regulator of sigma subunit)/anti-sigma regulatory factor (Ser/Thr protein kinase)
MSMGYVQNEAAGTPFRQARFPPPVDREAWQLGSVKLSLKDSMATLQAIQLLFSPRSIGQRFALSIGAGAGIILIVLALANYHNGRELLLQQTSSEALKEVNDEMRAMDDLVERMAMLPYVIGATETDTDPMTRVSVPWLASLLEKCPIHAVYGLYMVYDGKDWRDPASDIWVDRKSWPNCAHLKYDFHDEEQDWYHGAKTSGQLHVTQPYFDEGGSDIDMVSITQPIYDHAGKFLGVAGADVALDEMRKIVRKMHIRSFGSDLNAEEGIVDTKKQNSNALAGIPREMRESAYLISQTGAIIVSPESGKDEPAPKPSDPQKNPESALQDLLSQGLVTSLPGLEKILASDSGWLHLRDHSDKVIYWAKGQTTGWKLVLEVPYALIVAPARKLAEQSILIGGIGLILLLGVIFYTARRISEPISRLQKVASDFEKGSYNEGKEVLERIGKRQDELGRFAQSFSAMAGEIRLREERLSEWNANLEETIRLRTVELEKANKAMASELAEAAAYSRAVLPERLKGAVSTDWVFISSSQLGGDSFGYHWIDDDTLSLYLLDVCGHGVGAALLSISVVNMLRSGSLADTDFRDPSAVLKNLNAAFPMEQHNEMYFTGWYGVYSRTKGTLCYASGGHPPAVLISPHGEVQHLASKGAVLGAFPQASYETLSVNVTPGSRLYLFSDGTYEVDRPDGEMMTHDEFSAILADKKRPSGLEPIVEEIRRQQGTDSFADDFSLVEFVFPEKEGGKVKTISNEDSPALLLLRSDLPELAKLNPFLEEFCSREGLPADLVPDLELILEELATNVMKYGGVESGADCCRIELERRPDEVEIRFSDAGAPFNPLSRAEVDTSLPIEDRPIGGLGIHFIKHLTDSQHYEFRDGRNILTLVKKVDPTIDFEV